MKKASRIKKIWHLLLETKGFLVCVCVWWGEEWKKKRLNKKLKKSPTYYLKKKERISCTSKYSEPKGNAVAC